MSFRTHSRRRDILDQDLGWFYFWGFLGVFFSQLYNKYFTFKKKKILGVWNILACVNFNIDYFKAPFFYFNNILSILRQLFIRNWRSQCEYLKAGSRCYALTDPQKGTFSYENGIKMKADTRDDVTIINLWSYIFYWRLWFRINKLMTSRNNSWPLQHVCVLSLTI